MQKNENQTSVHLIWGSEYLDGGFTTVPNMVIRYAPKLVTGKEFHLLMVLSSFKHDSQYPFPSQQKLADIMGVSVRQIRKLTEGLEDKGLMIVQYRYDNQGRTSNMYNFKPLLDACLSLHMREQMKINVENGVKIVTKTKRKKVTKKNEEPEQNVPLLPEQNVPEPPEQNVPEPPEQNVPMNITSINITNKKITNRILQSINQSGLNDNLKNILSKNIDRLTDEDINFVIDIFNQKNISDTELFILISKVLQSNVKTTFKSYLSKTIVNHMNDIQKASDSQNNSVRKEMIPNFMNEEKLDTKQNEASQEQVNILDAVKVFAKMAITKDKAIERVQKIIPGVSYDEISKVYDSIK